MLIIMLVIFGVILSLASLTANIFLWISCNRQMNKADIYQEMYNDIVLRTKERVLNTYLQMKQLDDKEIFSKDDEVGVSFKQILEILQEFNELTQEEETQEGE